MPVLEYRRAVSCARSLLGRERKRLFNARFLLVENLSWVEVAFKAVFRPQQAPSGFSPLAIKLADSFSHSALC
jgi:hypothetical protein